jgi:hypothetical protein
MNSTFPTLILKEDNHSSFSIFRSISLCNASYKLMTNYCQHVEKVSSHNHFKKLGWIYGKVADHGQYLLGSRGDPFQPYKRRQSYDHKVRYVDITVVAGGINLCV